MDQHLLDNRKSTNGYVTLITVLALGAIAASLATAMILLGSDSSRTSDTLVDAAAARAAATTCAELALQEIWDDENFTTADSGTIDVGTATCLYAVSNTGGENRTITAYGSAGSSVQALTVTVNEVTESVEITSWIEL